MEAEYLLVFLDTNRLQYNIIYYYYYSILYS